MDNVLVFSCNSQDAVERFVSTRIGTGTGTGIGIGNGSDDIILPQLFHRVGCLVENWD